MTPFDPAALVAVLAAFYPTVSTDALAQARRERPRVFAGGALVGAGDRLQLADGRVFLLIWQGGWTCVGDTANADAAGVWDAARIAAFFVAQSVVVADSVIQQWLGYWALWGWKDPGYFVYRLSHAQELVDAGKADALPAETGSAGLELEEGPLAPLDEDMELFGFGASPTMESIVSDALGGLDGAEPALDRVAAGAGEFDAAGASAELDDGSLDDAGAEHDGTVAAVQGLTLDDVIAATSGQQSGVAPNRADYDEPPPPQVDVPDPGDPPDKGGGGDSSGPPPA